jgi:hypothetical protein
MIEIKKITSGELNGETVWICDLRYTDFANKPIRHVRPTQVMVRPNSETKKKIYYSESHFAVIGKNGKPLKSKIIAPYDTTGYRAYTGTPVSCFCLEKECIQHYKEQVEAAIDGLIVHKAKVAQAINDEIGEFYEILAALPV